MEHPVKHHGGNPANRGGIIWITILSAALIVSIGVTVWALFFRNTTPVLVPDYAPREKEQNAEPVDGNPAEKMEYQQGGGAVSMIYSKEISVDLSDKTVHLMFANQKKSNQDMMVQAVIHDAVIAQSGLLPPGYQVTKLDLWDTVKLSAGQYDGKLVAYYFQTDSGEKAILNTEIPLTVTVEE